MGDSDLVAAAEELLRRRRARGSLLQFILYMNPEYIVSDFSEEVCAALDSFLVGMAEGRRPILVLGAPPQHGKSDIVSRYLPAYVFGKFPDLKIGGLSYAANLASSMNGDVQRIMLSPEYSALFPETQLNQRRAVHMETQAKRNSEEFEIVGRRGSYVSQGVGGPLTGKRIDLGIIDDPIKNAQEALSPTTKGAVWNWYVSTFLTRLSKNSGQIIMATRWARDDLSGRVLEKYERAKSLVFQAISPQGEALVPDLHPLEKLLEIKATMGDYFWSAMYQQSPKVIGGTVFKEHGIRHYLPKDLPDKLDKVIHSWDMTFKDSEGTDYVVGQVWGKSGSNCYLLEQIRDRLSFTETVKAVRKLAADYPEGRRKLVEDKANGPAVLDTLKNEVSGLTPVEPDGSKVARAHAMTAEWEAGNIYLPHPEVAPWITEFIDNVTSFPACAHDDEIDAMTQAIRDLYSTGGGSFFTQKRRRA